MIALLVLACSGVGLQASADQAATADIAVHATVGDPAPAQVILHWRSSDGSIADAPMQPDGECAYSGVVPGDFTRLDYWVDALDASGNLIANAGRADAPLVREWSPEAPWCDEPCECGGSCGDEPQVVAPVERPPPPPPARDRRYRIDLAAGATSHGEPIGTLAVGVFVSRKTELRLAGRTTPLALMELRQFLRGGLAIELAAGGGRTLAGGGGAAYRFGLSRRVDAAFGVTALVDLDRVFTVDAQAGVSVSW